jgi:glyoxylase-like metal-dependent hydrolase (beta-lactamase superfamily II)
MASAEVADGVWVVTAGAFSSNSYICALDAPGQAILIDAGLDPQAIEDALVGLGLEVSNVFCTHGHFDHLGGAAFFSAKYGAPVHLHASDLPTAQRNNFLLMAMGLPDRITLPEVELVEDGQAYDFHGRLLTFRHCPGHTPGSCVIEFGRDMFSGDSIYARGVGLSKLPGERPDQLRASIRTLWDRLDDFVVHPGHGPSAPGATVKEDNLALRKFLKADQT